MEHIERKWLDRALVTRYEWGLAPALHSDIMMVELDGAFFEDAPDLNRMISRIERLIGDLESWGAIAVAVDLQITGGEEASHAEGIPVIGGKVLNEDGSVNVSSGLGFSGFGLLNVNIDSDRIWRRYALYQDSSVEGAKQREPSLALSILNEIGDQVYPPPVPLADHHQWSFINFRHPYFDQKFDRSRRSPSRVYLHSDIRGNEERFNSSVVTPFTGTVVLIGTGSERDGKATCMGGQEPGLFLHATVLSDLLQGKTLHRAGLGSDLIVYLCVAAVAWLIAVSQGRKLRLTLGLGSLVGLLGAFSFWCIWRQDYIPGAAGALSVVGMIFVGELWRRHTEELSERARRDVLLRYYFSPEVREQLLADPGNQKPQIADIAILISDVRGFTKFSESAPLETVFRLLNRIFAIQSRAVLENKGSLQHFWGDQFVAYWGAPISREDAADLAYRCAQTVRIELQKEFEKESLRLDIGIGLNFGTALFGNVGSGDYLDYSILGDSVNVAARVESATRGLDCPLLMTDAFLKELSDPPEVSEGVSLPLKGRAEPVVVYSPKRSEK